ncbi:MAG: divergent PAP2 family protein [Anaerolineae bacterium]|jgi:acid phosphatase family membrane protein YuiD
MNEVLQNPALVYGLLCWGIAQVLKVATSSVREHRLNWRMLFSAGGMPSSHTAIISSITVGIAISEGIDSPLFALAVGIAGVVMYDAAGVRRAAGHQAAVLNQIIDELFQGHPISEERLRELLGHTPLQVLAGAILGVAVTWIGMKFVWSGS